MIGFLRTWITNIAVAMIFISVLGMLMPNSDMKRYVKVIAGLIIILIIIKPFIMLKDINVQFKNDILETSDYIESDINQKGNELGKYQQTQTIEIFKENIRNQVKTIVSDMNSIDKNSVDVEVSIESDFSKEDYGRITELQVIINDTSNITISVNKVKQVDISDDKTVMNENKTEYNLNNSKLCSEIKSSIHNILGINEDNIKVEIRE